MGALTSGDHMTSPRAATAQVELSTGETLIIKAFTARQLVMDDAVPDALADIAAGIREIGESSGKRIIAANLAQTAAAERGEQDIAAVAEAVTAVSAPIPLETLIKRCRRPLAVLLRVAVDRPNEFWDELELSDFEMLAAVVFQVNKAQHGKKLAPALAQLLGALTGQPNA